MVTSEERRGGWREGRPKCPWRFLISNRQVHAVQSSDEVMIELILARGRKRVGPCRKGKEGDVEEGRKEGWKVAG